MQRTAVAHFNDNSFAIKWKKLDRTDEYNMASESYYALSIQDERINKFRSGIIYLGEHLMLGAYILAKLGGREYLRDFMCILYTRFCDIVRELSEETDDKDILHDIFKIQSNYFEHCLDYGFRTGMKMTAHSSRD
ncbi:MAG: hypothetical protein AAB779_01560 [Patescibacteria group bacterium]